MRGLLAQLATLITLLAFCSVAAAAPPKVPSVLKGSASGETVIANVDANGVSSSPSTTTWKIENFKLKLVKYLTGTKPGTFRIVYQITGGTVSLTHVAQSTCSTSFSLSGKAKELIESPLTDAIFGFIRNKKKWTIDTHVRLKEKTDVTYTCNYYPGEPPTTTIDAASLPDLFQIVPLYAPLKPSKRMKLHYTHSSAKNGSSINIVWDLNLKGSKFTKRPRN